LPRPALGVIADALSAGHLINYASVILAMGLFNILGSLQNIESAEAAGDPYPTRPSLFVNGVGSVAAALFGSCFPTTIYIGHPGWKAIGARAGYSILNGAFITLVCFSGTLAYIAWAVPIDAGMAIVLWIGVVIGAQAFEATPREHAPAVVMGLLPGIGAWGALMAKSGVRAAGGAFGPDLVAAFHRTDTWIDGAFALEQGFLFTAMLLSAATVAVIERRFRTAAGWCAAAAALSAVGLMHGYRWTGADGVPLLRGSLRDGGDGGGRGPLTERAAQTCVSAPMTYLAPAHAPFCCVERDGRVERRSSCENETRRRARRSRSRTSSGRAGEWPTT
jgi:AGZA family xanthine/uracil permease-like MFS transporter